MFVHKVVEASRNLQKKRTPCWDTDMPKEEGSQFTKAVEVAREYAQSLTEINKTIPWNMLDFAAIIHGQLKQIGALTIACYWDHCQNFPLSVCTRYLRTGVRKSVAQKHQLILLQAWTGAKWSGLPRSSLGANRRCGHFLHHAKADNKPCGWQQTLRRR